MTPIWENLVKDGHETGRLKDVRQGGYLIKSTDPELLKKGAGYLSVRTKAGLLSMGLRNEAQWFTSQEANEILALLPRDKYKLVKRQRSARILHGEEFNLILLRISSASGWDELFTYPKDIMVWIRNNVIGQAKMICSLEFSAITLTEKGMDKIYHLMCRGQLKDLFVAGKLMGN